METSPQAMDQHAVSRTPWYTLISQPSAFFRSRRDHIGWFWISVIFSLVTLINAWAESQYFYKTHILHSKLPPNVIAAETARAAGVVVGGFASPWVVSFVGGFLLWLLVKLFGGKLRYLVAVGIAANINIVMTLRCAISTVYIEATWKMPYGLLSLHSLLPVPGHFGSLLGAINVFLIWAAWLLTVAVRNMTVLDRSKVFGIIASYCGVQLLIALAASAPA